MILEDIKIVKKKWGSEKWFFNCDEYCCKFLYVNKGASGSLHCHCVKKESFAVLSGVILLELEGEIIKMAPDFRTVTILPGQWHRYTGIEDSIILEGSTHHEDNDTVRKEESRSG